MKEGGREGSHSQAVQFEACYCKYKLVMELNRVYLLRQTFLCFHERYILSVFPKGAAKDIQQLFTAIDRRIEALKRNIQHSQESSEQQNEAFRLAAPTASTSFDEDDKESFFDEHHSSPESSPETHTSTRLRQVETNPVPVPEQRASSNSRSSIVSAGSSDCEGGRGKQEEEVGKEEKDSGAKKLSEVPSESSTSAATMRNNSSNLPEPT